MISIGKIRALSKNQKLTICLIVIVLYAVAFIVAYFFFLNSATIIAVIPIFFIAYIFGIRGGVLSGIFIYFFNSILIYFIASPEHGFYMGKQYLFYHAIFLFAGITSGYISKIKLKLEVSYDEMIETKNQLKIINQILRHDLANNLTVINSSLNLYQTKNNEKFLFEAEERTKRGLSLIKKMRELEYILEKPEKLKEYSVKEIIKNIEPRYNDLTITCFGDAEILADNALTPLFDNLISNSMLHGNARKIDISVYSEETEVLVKVKDDGNGIPDNIKKRIFDEGFSQGGNSNSGLGLYIVKKVMNRYGGKINVEDNLPKGTVFNLTFRTPE